MILKFDKGWFWHNVGGPWNGPYKHKLTAWLVMQAWNFLCLDDVKDLRDLIRGE